MCHHVFKYPPDEAENYDPDNTLTGVCEKCGAIQKSYGVRWILDVEEKLHRGPAFDRDDLSRTEIRF